jgi:hypothetical protein
LLSDSRSGQKKQHCDPNRLALRDHRAPFTKLKKASLGLYSPCRANSPPGHPAKFGIERAEERFRGRSIPLFGSFNKQ